MKTKTWEIYPYQLMNIDQYKSSFVKNLDCKYSEINAIVYTNNFNQSFYVVFMKNTEHPFKENK